LPRDGKPAIILDHGCELNAAEIWVQDRYVYGEPAPRRRSASESVTAATNSSIKFSRTKNRHAVAADALTAALSDRGLLDGRIGFEWESIPPDQRAAVHSYLPHAELCDASNLFRLVRMVKSDEER